MSTFDIFDLTIQSLCLVTGLTGNSFILIVHFLDWLRTREYNPCNLILNGIAAFNIFLQGILVLQEFIYILFEDFYAQFTVMMTLYVVVTSLSLSSLCCSTCLCFYYCVKIVQFPGTLFYKLKAKLPVLVPLLLVFSIVLSWGVGIPYYLDYYLEDLITTDTITTDNSTENITTMMSDFNSKCNFTLQIYTFVSSVAFIIILLTTGAIIASLCQHMRRMRQNNDHGHSRINTHLSAARTMTSLFIAYLIFYIAFIVQNILSDNNILTAGLFVMTLFPTINAVILISGNRNLTNVLKKMLCMQSVGNLEVTVTTY